MNRYILILQLIGWLAALPAPAQTTAGDGLKGDYYAGVNFERYVLTRRDTLVNFEWQGASPGGSVPAEEFSVRWTGWLVPPVSGHYVLHLRIDDGVRLWVDGRQRLNEWRGQPRGFYEVALDLTAGQAYALRLDYCQYSGQTQAALAWERPDKPTPASSRRKLWGKADSPAAPEIIPTRYLFSNSPLAAASEPSKPAPLPVPVAKAPAAATTRPKSASRIQPAPLRPRARRPAGGALGSAVKPSPDSVHLVAIVSRLAAGQTITLHTLYFEQGKAELLPAVQASLDTLAGILRQRPTLRLEVQGHTDNQGNPTLNRQLSQQRAELVCQYLAAHGVVAERLRPVGYGGSRPVADNRNVALRAQNRRVVLQPLPPR